MKSEVKIIYKYIAIYEERIVAFANSHGKPIDEINSRKMSDFATIC